MGSIHHLTLYIPKLAQTATALSPLLKITEKIERLTGNQNTKQYLTTS